MYDVARASYAVNVESDFLARFIFTQDIPHRQEHGTCRPKLWNESPPLSSSVDTEKTEQNGKGPRAGCRTLCIVSTKFRANGKKALKKMAENTGTSAGTKVLLDNFYVE